MARHLAMGSGSRSCLLDGEQPVLVTQLADRFFEPRGGRANIGWGEQPEGLTDSTTHGSAKAQHLPGRH